MSNLTTHGRQNSLFIEQVIDYTDLASVATSLVQPRVPANAIVIGGGVFIETAFTGSSPTFNVGDSGSATAYLSALDLGTVAYTAFTAGKGIKASGDTFLIAPNSAAQGSTAGKARLIVEYLIAGRSSEAQA